MPEDAMLEQVQAAHDALVRHVMVCQLCQEVGGINAHPKALCPAGSDLLIRELRWIVRRAWALGGGVW